LTFENSGVAGLDSQRSDVGYYFWTCFKNDEEYSNRAGHADQFEAIIKPCPQRNFPACEEMMSGTAGSSVSCFVVASPTRIFEVADV